ncbi:MAG: MATE family efflux transporter [Clostridia bacterium]|nr:MATE family efflux transporter [Clostridia bacterium]
MYKRCIKTAWPAAVESVFIALMGLIDTFMVSRLGETAISAVGITTQPKFLFMALIFALNIGVTAVIARLKGEGDNIGCRRTLTTGIIISTVISAIMTVIAFFFSRPILLLAGAQDSFLEDANDYFLIIMIGQFFNCISTTINAAQRGIGNTKIAMITNTAANILNIIFNALLINGLWIFPRLGVKGAAIATTIGNIAAFLLSMACILNRKNEISVISRGILKYDRRIISGTVRIGSSGLVEQVFMRIGFFTFAALIANLGDIPFATHQICMNILHISFAMADGFSVAATGLVGQSLGEKRPDCAMIYAKACQRFTVIISAVLFIFFLCLRRELILIFSDTPQVVELGSIIVVIIAVTGFFQTSQFVLSGSLKGAGDSKYLAIISFVGTTIIRPVISWLLCYPLSFGLIGAWLGMFVEQVVRLILNSVRFSNGKWAQIKV